MMNILLSTPVFKPMVGGMEIMAENLALHLSRRGYEVTVVTPTPFDGTDEEPYRIVRQPSPGTFYRLAKSADLIFSKGASLYAAPYAMLTGKPFVMCHAGYQASVIDGAGWYKGRPAPTSTIPSFLFHLKNGKFLDALRGIIKVTTLRAVAKYYVATNVAISDWMMSRHPLPRQIRIHNPFPITKFIDGKNISGQYTCDFFFLGRLVTEKGVDVLVDAFTEVQRRTNNRYRLCIIGDGPERERLEEMVRVAKQKENVTFTGILTKNPLTDQLRACKIAVLPSIWEEPFGGVASEMLAAGKNIIVSRDGAMPEIIGDAGLSFPNGDSMALADVMLRLAEDEQLQQEQRVNAERRVKAFDEGALVEEYMALFSRITNMPPPLPKFSEIPTHV